MKNESGIEPVIARDAPYHRAPPALHDRVRVLRVLSLPTQRGPAPEAQTCYEELGIDEPSARS